MTDIEAINEVLGKLGSAHRVVAGDYVSVGMAELVKAIPAYIDAEVARAVKKKIDERGNEH